MPYTPSVSVIVPVYKQEKYLCQCLESVANQTFRDWECIVVDDGSDNPDLIDYLCHNLLRKRGSVIHQSNRGLATAPNTGIENASGHFLLCLDADDYLHLECLEKTTAVLYYSWACNLMEKKKYREAKKKSLLPHAVIIYKCIGFWAF